MPKNAKRPAQAATRTSLMKDILSHHYCITENLRSQAERVIVATSIFALILACLMIGQVHTTKKELAALETSVQTISEQQAAYSVQLDEFFSRQDELTKSVMMADTPLYARDVPLSDELQRYTYITCNEYGIDYDMLLAIMEVESNYQNIVSNSGKDYGLCQINKANNEWLAEEYGLTDMLDERQNITAACIILAKVQEEFTAPNEILMGYNLGIEGAKRRISNGVESTYYADKVMEAMNGDY